MKNPIEFKVIYTGYVLDFRPREKINYFMLYNNTRKENFLDFGAVSVGSLQ